MRTRELPAIGAGESFGFCAGASLAVDPERLIAYVVGAHAPVAEVDLRTMRVELANGSARRSPTTCHLRPSGPRSRRVRPAGAVIIDTLDWTARTIARRAGEAIRAGDRLLVVDLRRGRVVARFPRVRHDVELVRPR